MNFSQRFVREENVIQNERVAVGLAIRTMRRGRMSLQELAEKANVSVGTLSKIENGLGNPSLALLGRVAAALNVETCQLLSPPEFSATAIVRKSERPKFRTVHNYHVVELLTPDILHNPTVSYSVLAPGESSCDAGYSGELCLLIRSGRMQLDFKTGESVHLYPGDSVCYSAPHSGIRRNIGPVPLEFIGVFSRHIT
jgi:transcriptional regulator with XRE-family HTH domain